MTKPSDNPLDIGVFTPEKLAKVREGASGLAEAIRNGRKVALRALWDLERPHFGEQGGPHRYDGGFCIYCGRPQGYQPKK